MLLTQGYAAQSAKSPLAPFQFNRREPKDKDVLIKIEYCGICHSDIHQARDEWGGSVFPMVPGHEMVGEVIHLGKSVQRFKIGEKVGVGCFVDSCRECASCKEGLEQYCQVGPNFSYNSKEKDGSPAYGGYSTQIVVDENYVLGIPKNLALDKTAPLLCAGITTYSPLKHWNAGPGKKVAVIGLGGLGHMAVKIASAMKAEVTVLSQTLKKSEDAKRFGAKHCFATSDKEMFTTLKGSFDLIINTVSSAMNWNDYLSLLKRDGTFVILGVPSKEVPVGASSLIMGRKTLAGSLIGGIAETQEMLDFCGKHNITSDIELISADKINEAYERVLKSDVRYRFVIDINSIK